MRSTDRILTTHTGSLPRPPELIDLMRRREQGEAVDGGAGVHRHRGGHDHPQQLDAGIDIVSDGERQARLRDLHSHARQRLRRHPVAATRPVPSSATFRVRRASRRHAGQHRLATELQGPVAWTNFAAVQTDIDRQRRESRRRGAHVHDRSIARRNLVLPAQRVLPERRRLPRRVRCSDARRVRGHREGRLRATGLPGPRDGSPVLVRPTSRVPQFGQTPRRGAEPGYENIPAEQIRLHLCWGNYEGPHHCDIPLRDIIDIVAKANYTAISFEGANPRHEHEWTVFEDVKLPDGKVLFPGVIDSTTNFIEHPELIAQRIERYADLVGRENVIAGSDCGFSIHVGMGGVDPDVTYRKLAAMAEGARIASRKYWPKAA